MATHLALPLLKIETAVSLDNILGLQTPRVDPKPVEVDGSGVFPLSSSSSPKYSNSSGFPKSDSLGPTSFSTPSSWSSSKMTRRFLAALFLVDELFRLVLFLFFVVVFLFVVVVLRADDFRLVGDLEVVFLFLVTFFFELVFFLVTFLFLV